MTLGNGIQSVDYSYTIRDWLKSVNSNQFSQTLNYDDAAVNPRFNGNIAEMSWTTAGNAGAYHFTYDHANRLTDAVTTSGPDFSEKLISYDANGNLLSLTRGTNSPIAYHYSDANKPNQLSSVTGGLAATYSYDANGNMTYDNTKGEFTYDYRNLPIKVTTNDTVIEYAYDASGQRIRKTLKNNGNTLSETIYIRGTGGNVIAEYRDGQIDHFNIYGNGLIGKLAPANRLVTINNQTISGTQTIQASDSVLVTGESIIQDEVTLEAGSQIQIADKRYYYLSDHLGSTRVVLDQNGNVDSWTDYYPFGKEARGSSTVNAPKEGFSGKQLDVESGLNYFGARYYNPEIGRFNSNDRFSFKYPSLNPYQYAANNPLRYIDFNGDDVEVANPQNEKEKIEYKKGKLYWKGSDKEYDGDAKRKGTGFFSKVVKFFAGEYKGFVGDSYNALKKIESGGGEAAKVISNLVESDQTTTIKEGKLQSYDPNSGTITWNPNSMEQFLGANNQLVESPTFVGLAHELKHADNKVSGVYDDSPWYTNANGLERIKDEQSAGAFENLVRRQHNIPYRAYYDVHEKSGGGYVGEGPLEMPK